MNVRYASRADRFIHGKRGRLSGPPVPLCLPMPQSSSPTWQTKLSLVNPASPRGVLPTPTGHSHSGDVVTKIRTAAAVRSQFTFHTRLFYTCNRQPHSHTGKFVHYGLHLPKVTKCLFSWHETSLYRWLHRVQARIENPKRFSLRNKTHEINQSVNQSMLFPNSVIKETPRAACIKAKRHTKDKDKGN
jgi:hypothetical protein